MTPIWLDPSECESPHGVVRPEQVDDLVEAFFYGGWDLTKPALVGYLTEMHGKVRVQLLSGSHRWAAAFTAGIKIPVVVHPYSTVARAHGNLVLWSHLMWSGHPSAPERSEGAHGPVLLNVQIVVRPEHILSKILD